MEFTAIMPSDTITSATIASSRVKPRHAIRLAPIEPGLGNLQRAVQLSRQLEPARETVPRHREPERRDFAARQQHDLRFRLVQLHLLEVSLQLDVAPVEHEVQ